MHAREVAVFLSVVILVGIGGFVAFASAAPTDIVARGVSVGPFDVSGMTAYEVRTTILEGTKDFTLAFEAAGVGSFEIPVSQNRDEDVAFDIDAMVKRALGVGHDGGLFIGAKDKFIANTVGLTVPLLARIDPAGVTEALAVGFPSLVRPAENAAFRITVETDGTHAAELVPERNGQTFDERVMTAAIIQHIGLLDRGPIPVTVHDDMATLSSADVAPLETDIADLLDNAPLSVTAGGETWTLSRSTVADWILPVRDDAGAPALGLDQRKVEKYMEARATAINVEPQNAVFEEKDGRVVSFSAHKQGRELDLDASFDMLLDALTTEREDDLALEFPLRTTDPELTLEDVNPYGIKELIAIGESNFRGSPVNRRKNIARGAELMRGVLVAPDAEFSLLSTLEPFDGTNGYFEELVIKENETKPEYGGGLCQIGTTTFRGVLNAGFPVTARQNHSYRVPYYERDGDGNYIGPGTDATIYDPAPDFRFKNDSPAHVMIWTVINGDRLTFSYWGVKDGRVAEQGAVSVYNLIDPPPTKLVHTTSIPAGTKKCTESPHIGSTASFPYKVTYADGTVKARDFLSVYRPWQEVCLVGVTPEELAAIEAAEAQGTEDAPAEGDLVPPTGGLSSADAEGAAGN